MVYDRYTTVMSVTSQNSLKTRPVAVPLKDTAVPAVRRLNRSRRTPAIRTLSSPLWRPTQRGAQYSVARTRALPTRTQALPTPYS